MLLTYTYITKINTSKNISKLAIASESIENDEIHALYVKWVLINNFG